MDATGACPDTAAGDWRERRLALCLSNLPFIVAGTFHAGGRPVMRGRAGMGEAEAHRAIRSVFPGLAPRQVVNQYAEFVAPILASFARLGIDADFLVVLGDNTGLPHAPAFCRTRPIRDPRNAVLSRLGFERHFGPMGKVAALDRPWKDKSDRLVWRGATTGVFRNRPGAADRSSRSFVAAAMRRCTDARIDLGYSQIVQVEEGGSDVGLARIRACLRPGLDLDAHLSCKYLLSLEGNEVASGLRWMLASNSVVVMPCPVYESWACESLLEPFVHYVPVRPNLSDLETVVEWCRANDAACEAIARNGRAYMAQFADLAADTALADAITAQYASRVTIA